VAGSLSRNRLKAWSYLEKVTRSEPDVSRTVMRTRFSNSISMKSSRAETCFHALALTRDRFFWRIA
jgi:hypothetical protein